MLRLKDQRNRVLCFILEIWWGLNLSVFNVKLSPPEIANVEIIF